MTTTQTQAAVSRDSWRRLDRFERSFLRAEYRHLRKSGVHPIIAHGSIRRVEGMLFFARTMGALGVHR